MGWFTKKKTVEPVQESKDIWTNCSSCKEPIYKTEWEKNVKVCPKCGFHDRLTAHERIQMIIDKNTFVELFTNVTTSDPLNFVDAKGKYAEKQEEAKKNTGLKESVVTGRGRLGRKPVVVSVMDFRFMGGSLGSGTGERISLGAEYAIKHKFPYIVFCASGGARMQEGTVALMQMAKTCAAIERVKKHRIPYIAVLTDPTTGGVSASFAMVGDMNVAEPGAMIAFAGRRVIEQTIKQELPADFQTAEYLVKHGFVDKIVHRKDMKSFLSKVIAYWRG